MPLPSDCSVDLVCRRTSLFVHKRLKLRNGMTILSARLFPTVGTVEHRTPKRRNSEMVIQSPFISVEPISLLTWPLEFPRVDFLRNIKIFTHSHTHTRRHVTFQGFPVQLCARRCLVSPLAAVNGPPQSLLLPVSDTPYIYINPSRRQKSGVSLEIFQFGCFMVEGRRRPGVSERVCGRHGWSRCFILFIFFFHPPHCNNTTGQISPFPLTVSC